jgi:trehalose-6-phosphatase
MKIVFLDFDGPIIPQMSHDDNHPMDAWPSCIAALNRITDTTDAKIVVSSTWRAGGLSEMRNLLSKWGANAEVIGLTPVLLNETRGKEIAEYLKAHPETESFVILDDDDDMDESLPFLVITPFATGLTEKHADRAIKILNG